LTKKKKEKAKKIIDELTEKPLSRPEGLDEILKKITEQPIKFKKEKKKIITWLSSRGLSV